MKQLLTKGLLRMTARTLTQFLTKRLSLMLIPLTALLLAGTPALALPTLEVVGGELRGASGVDVGGTLYDVEFLDGTCVALFMGCDSASDFTFQTSAGAFAASRALLAQVLLDTSALRFDEFPALTRGCTTFALCQIYTPFRHFPSRVISNIASNRREQFADAYGGLISFAATQNTEINNSGTWARWAPAATAAPVPEPTTMMLLSTGLVGLVGYRWRQGRREGQQVG